MARYFIDPDSGSRVEWPSDRQPANEPEKLEAEGLVEVDQVAFERHRRGLPVDWSRFDDDGPELDPAA